HVQALQHEVEDGAALALAGGDPGAVHLTSGRWRRAPEELGQRDGLKPAAVCLGQELGRCAVAGSRGGRRGGEEFPKSPTRPQAVAQPIGVVKPAHERGRDVATQPRRGLEATLRPALGFEKGGERTLLGGEQLTLLCLVRAALLVERSEER